MMYLELQEGKPRMMRLRFADEHSVTVATMLRMVAAMGLGEVSLPDGEKLRRVIVGDSWFASRATAAALKKEFGVEFTGCVKTAQAVFSNRSNALGFTESDSRRILRVQT